MAGAMDSMAVHRARDAPHAPDNATRRQRTGAATGADHKDFVGVVQRVRDRERLQIDDADRAIIAARDQRGHSTPAPELTGANPVRAHARMHARMQAHARTHARTHAHALTHARTHTYAYTHACTHARTHSHELDRNGRDGPNRQVSLALQCNAELQPMRLFETHRP